METVIAAYFVFGYFLFSLLAFSAACICDDLYQLRKINEQQQAKQKETASAAS